MDPAKNARKQQLIAATIESIYLYGLEKTTISKVTQLASLSAGTINFYFENKETLLLETLSSVSAEFQQQILDSINEDSGSVEILKKIIRLHFTSSLCSPQKISVWYAFADASRTRRIYNSICGDFEKKLEQILHQHITCLCNQEQNSHYHPRALTRGLQGMLDSFWQDYLYQPDSFDLEQANRQCVQYLESLFPESFDSKQESQGSITSEKYPLKKSDLLAPWTYHNQELLDLEIEQLFKPNWILAGHVSDVENPGDYLTFDGFGERALIVRGHDGKLRAFHNVCRHRGARLLEGQGHDCPHALTCAFHGWTYDLTGKLIGIPARDTFDGLIQEENGLVTIDLEVWMGFVFIRFKAEGESIRDTLAPVEHLIAPYKIDKMQALPGTHYRELRPYNWKVIHDIDNEGYHVPIGHPTLQQLYGKNYKDGRIENIPVTRGYLNDKSGDLWTVKHYQALLPEFDHLPQDHQRLWLYIGIFPNLVIGLYPDNIEFYMTIPEGLSTTRFIGCSYGLPDDRRAVSAARYLHHRIDRITDGEDTKYVEWMQSGRKSSAFPEQHLSSLEQGVRQFHKDIQSAIPVANLANEPAPGLVSTFNAQLS